ncbi:MAG: 4Fe-4S dicluster domain-containing protein [Caldisphaera sp.]|nr:(Fe-S)-binding protein [Caldisphaera sp.]
MSYIKILEDVEKCAYCGFCEVVCPTLPLGPHRGYGPRGRVNIIKEALSNKILTDEMLSSIYSCLMCNSCYIVCPARINVGLDVRETKSLINNNFFNLNKNTIVISER